jgi:hypothetical protein
MGCNRANFNFNFNQAVYGYIPASPLQLNPG